MTQKWRDPSYLSENQYRNQDNLQARIFLHQTFTQAEEDWFSWVWRMMNIQSGDNFSGSRLRAPAHSGSPLRKKLPLASALRLPIHLVGMVRACQRNIHAVPHLSALSATRRNLPFVSARYQRGFATTYAALPRPYLDAALAGNAACFDARRWLIAATNGGRHMLA
jgi:hypothetical protein